MAPSDHWPAHHVSQRRTRVGVGQQRLRAEVYKVDKQTEADLMKAQMQNDSKEAIASIQTIADALMQSQQEITGKVAEIEDREEVDLNPVLEALQALQKQMYEMQTVGIKQIRDESGRLVGGVRILADGSQQEISIQ